MNRLLKCSQMTILAIVINQNRNKIMANVFDTTIENPCEMWVRFKAGKDQGIFQGYDKTVQDDDKKIIDLGKTINIIPLFQHFGVGGWNNDQATGIYSNEVKDIKNGILTVKSGNEILATGTWNQIKEKVKSNGGKFANVVYYALFLRNDNGAIVPRIGATKFSGAMSNAWISARINLAELKTLQVSCGNLVKDREVNGKKVKLPNPYFSVNIKKFQKNKELADQAMEFAKKLKVYFDGYFNKEDTFAQPTRQELPHHENVQQLPSHEEPAFDHDDDDDELPF